MGYTDQHIAGMSRWVQGKLAAREAKQQTQLQASGNAEVMTLEQAQRLTRGAFPGGQFSTARDPRSGFYTLLTPPDDYLMPQSLYYDTDLDRLIRASAWSYAAISGNSKAISLLPPVVQVRQNGAWTRAADDHPLWSWLADPLGADDTLPHWPWNHLIYIVAVQYYTYGNAYWIPFVSNSKDLLAVLPILQPQCMVVTEEDPRFGTAKEYTYKNCGNSGMAGQSWTADKVVNIMSPGMHWYRGSPPLQAALRSVQMDNIAVRRQLANLINKMAPGMVISVESADGGSVHSDQTTKIYEDLADSYIKAEHDGTPWIIGSGTKITPPLTNTELQYWDTRRASRDEILAVIGMPPPVAGILDKAILNNYKVANVSWWNTNLFPVLEMIMNSINVQMIQRIYGKNTRVHYDLSGTDVALQLLGARLDVALQYQKLGYSTNDIAAELDLGMPEHDYLNLPNQALITAGRLPEIQALLEALEDGSLAASSKPGNGNELLAAKQAVDDAISRMDPAPIPATA